MPSGSTFARTPNAHVAAKKRLPKRDWCPRGFYAPQRLQLSDRLAHLFHMDIILSQNADHPNEAVAMARSATQRGALSIGQLARRWGLGADRVRRLVENGLLPGSFKVPSAGKYGEAVRIPLSTIQQAEKQWAISDHGQVQMDRLPRRRRRGSRPKLTHLPELSREHDDECHGVGQYRGGRSDE